MTKASPVCWSNFRWVSTEVHGFCDIPNYRAFNADSVEGNFCLHINKVSFRLLSWLGKKDTHPFFSDTGKAGSHCGLTVPFLFQNPFAVFFIYLLQSWLTQKSFCSLSPVTFPTNCCSQQASSAFTHQPRVPQISQPTLKALASLLHHSSYPLQSFPHTMVLIHSCPSCPVKVILAWSPAVTRPYLCQGVKIPLNYAHVLKSHPRWIQGSSKGKHSFQKLCWAYSLVICIQSPYLLFSF